MFAGSPYVRRDRQRLGVADGLERDRARGIDVLIDERRRHLERVRVVVEVTLDVVLGQQRRRIDLEREQVADRVRVLAAVQAAQRDTTRRGLAGGGIDLAREPRREPVDASRRRAAAHRPAASGRRATCGSRAPRSPRRRQFGPATADRTLGRPPGRRGCGTRSSIFRRPPIAPVWHGTASTDTRRRRPLRRRLRMRRKGRLWLKWHTPDSRVGPARGAPKPHIV